MSRDCKGLTPTHTACAVRVRDRGLVYPGYPESAQEPINYFVHGMNFATMLVDAVLSSAPYFFVYIWTSWLVYAIIYALFSIAFFRLGGTDASGNVRLRCDRRAALCMASHSKRGVRCLRSCATQPYIYAVLDWRTPASAASAGLVEGVIVFVLVPLLGLLAYWLVFLRRARIAHEPIPAGAPGCAPPAGAVAPVLTRAASRLPVLRWLPLGALAVLICTFSASTPITTILKNQSYWRARVSDSGAVVPYISDTGATAPSYFVFAAGLTAGAAFLLATVRLVYERMDPLLAAVDDADGRYGQEGELLLPPAPMQGLSADSELASASMRLAPVSSTKDSNAYAVPPPTADMSAEADAERGAFAAGVVVGSSSDVPSTCWCSTGRWLHCCCCCSQSLRQQGRSAYICGATVSAALPLLGWTSVHIQIFVHSVGAAAAFLCMYLHMVLLARLQAARLHAAARHPGVPALAVSPADARSASLKATCVWSVPVGALLAFLVVLPASGRHAGSVWNGFLAPLIGAHAPLNRSTLLASTS